MGITFVDCTLRDGGYHNDLDFSVALTDEYLAAMAALGTDRVELGFRSLRRGGFKGSAAFTTDGFIDLLSVPDAVTLGVMINPAEVVLPVNEQRAALETLFPLRRATACVSSASRRTSRRSRRRSRRSTG